MQNKILLSIFFCLLSSQIKTNCEEFRYILNEACINNHYIEAKKNINNPEISIIKEAFGITIRFEIKNPSENYHKLSLETINLLRKTEYFLAKIKNPVIIEVHTESFLSEKIRGIKNWELSTVIANNIESYLIQNLKNISNKNISSIGYGEFMPAKNTPNNGGKYSNRVDIIIPCSINGE